MNATALITAIAKRAVDMAKAHGVQYDLLDATMDISLANTIIPLRLPDLLNADDFNFSHDVFGIRQYLDRRNHVMLDCFVPRYARRQL